MIRRPSAPSLLALLLAALLAAPSLDAGAEADGPDHYRIIGLGPAEMLALRDTPNDSALRIAGVPGDTDGLRNLGCRGGLSYAEWQAASDAERRAAADARWCRVGWRGIAGWAPGRHLAEGAAPEGPVTTWYLAGGAASLAFGADGALSGHTGCNRFNGRARIADGRLVLDGPAATTRMACHGPGDAIERRYLAVLGAGPAITYDPTADRLTLEGGGERLDFLR